MTKLLLAAAFFLAAAGPVVAQGGPTFYVGTDAVAPLVPGPGGILVGTGRHQNAVTYNVILTPVANKPGTYYASVIIDDELSTGTGGGFIGTNASGLFGRGQGFVTVKGFSGGRGFDFTVR